MASSTDMTAGVFIRRSLRFYWRTHLSVLAGVALTSAILTGALAVGDSVRHTLRQLALLRLGRITHALPAGDRLFRAALADETGTVPVLLLPGIVTLPDGRARANNVQVAGVDQRFWKLGATTNFTGVVVNERLAAQLGVRGGDTIVVRVEQPALISRDAPLSGRSDATVALRVRVAAIAGDNEFGRFSLHAEQVPPLTVFVPLPLLQAELNRPAKANALLTDGDLPDLRNHWTLEDAGLEIHSNQLRSSQVFIEPTVAVTALGLASNAVRVLTYFVNEIRLGDKATPYSFVTAVGAEEGIAINSWLADDLGAKIGDELALCYYVIGDRRELHEETARFRISRILPVEKDDSWMPVFPGLAESDSCRDWEPGIPIALDRIRLKDEAYWRQYRGTPKAFVSLVEGQRLWSNRFGNLTAIRFPQSFNVPAQLELEPPAFVPVREQALLASKESQDFGQLFVGFSLFLIVAALLLTGLLMAFNLEQRRTEIGLLRAVGFSPGQVWRLVLCEGFLIALTGTTLGLVCGVIYTKVTLLGLATVWRGAVGAAQFRYHVEPVTWVAGAIASLLTAVVAMVFVQRRRVRCAPVELLAGTPKTLASVTGSHRRTGLLVTVLGCVGAVSVLPVGKAGAFFGAGACLLVAGIGFSSWLLRRLETGASLGLRNATRCHGRSLTTIGVLASGVFLLVGVNSFHQDAQQAAHDRRSGTGGFAFYAQAALPVYEKLAGADAVALRLREGDDASCRNLNRTQQPRLLGVAPSELAKRGAFGGNWELLNQLTTNGAVPAIGDEATVTWALGKKVGDTLTYADEGGRLFQVCVVGVIPNSILQGSLVIQEKGFVEKFPSCGGYRVFLIDAMPAGLARMLEDKGFEVVTAWRRLAEFLEVENTYLAIFQVLGGLGLLLGSVGLAIVVLRNNLERRGELALLQAVGFRKSALRWLVVSEHWLVVTLGVLVGLLAALVAVWPSHGGCVPVLPLIALAVGGLAWSWLSAWLALRGPLLPALRTE